MSTMRACHVFISTIAFVCLAALPSPASITIYATHSDYAPSSGSLSDICMTVDLSVAGGIATMTFINTSVAPETTAVFKEIVVDLYDDDVPVGGDILWGAIILTNTSEISFTGGDSNGLPGYGPFTSDMPDLYELQADSPPTSKGLNIGESLVVQFNTILPDGLDRIHDYLAAFGGGSDTANYAIGFHAISASIIDGQSLSGMYVPEPATMLVVGLGALLVVIGRRVRR
jgi:hypothetical protein